MFLKIRRQPLTWKWPGRLRKKKLRGSNSRLNDLLKMTVLLHLTNADVGDGEAVAKDLGNRDLSNKKNPPLILNNRRNLNQDQRSNQAAQKVPRRTIRMLR